MRCGKGTRKNPKTGECVKKMVILISRLKLCEHIYTKEYKSKPVTERQKLNRTIKLDRIKNKCETIKDQIDRLDNPL
jgi:hypothetical protein